MFDRDFYLVFPNSPLIKNFQSFVSVMSAKNAGIAFSEIDAIKMKVELGKGFRVLRCEGVAVEDVTGILERTVCEEDEEG